MECPKCKQDYGEMITICPICFIEINQTVKVPAARDRRPKKERETRSDSKSKGLLSSSFSSWFGKSTPQEPVAPVKEKRKVHEHRFSKSSTSDYSYFSIDQGVMETGGVTPSQDFIASQSFTTEPEAFTSDIMTGDSLFSDRSEPSIMDGTSETMLSSAPSLTSQPVPPPKYEMPKTSVATKGSPSREQLAQEHYRKGYEYEKQNRLKEALSEYGQAIAFNPKWPEAYYRCGLILVKNKDYNTALQKLHDAVKLDPSNADAHYQIGKIYVDRNFKDDAEKYLKLAIKNNPKLTAAKNLLNNLCEKVSSVTQKTCPKCNSLQSNRAKFCGNCGYTFPK